MENKEILANALKMNALRGDSYSIEAVSQDGKKIITLVRITYDYADCLADSQREMMDDLFRNFCNQAEEIL